MVNFVSGHAGHTGHAGHASGSSSVGGGGGGGGGGSGIGGIIIGQPAWLQRRIHLRPQHRGVHLVTEEILRQVKIMLGYDDET
jgi:hypothetical protein